MQSEQCRLDKKGEKRAPARFFDAKSNLGFGGVSRPLRGRAAPHKTPHTAAKTRGMRGGGPQAGVKRASAFAGLCSLDDWVFAVKISFFRGSTDPFLWLTALTAQPA
jgi:hypothetical protein